MKRVRITIAPPDTYLPPVYQLLTSGTPYLSHVQIVNWNVADPPVGFLLRVRGDYEKLRQALTTSTNVRDFEVFPDSRSEAYCFLAAKQPTVGRALFENFTRDDLLTIPPIECYDDGSSSFTLVGTDTAIQAAIDGIPDGVDLSVEAVGQRPVTASGSLSPKQRDAVRAALRVGYYDVPREATTKDVAQEVGCAPATASEHLRKAESHVFSSLFESLDSP
ncbi:helix-turn-helix domain-containing protein [Haladaptatus sp. DYF46]|uniref:helix-turn-helix domain-containing protein n=1 Tax=Haladaptatus sp. DYF46 TaxID=2886041 RepID=UPI001E5C32FC|nr:helix-turn-helix domain-containing protein [Haladaptatus sp. DYF46]